MTESIRGAILPDNRDDCSVISGFRHPCNDVEITMWVRQSRVAEGLDQHLFGTVEPWIADCWPFTNPVYTGRRISFDEWGALPAE